MLRPSMDNIDFSYLISNFHAFISALKKCAFIRSHPCNIFKRRFHYIFNCFSARRYGRWVTRRIAVGTIAVIWILAGFVSFVPISLNLHRPDQPLMFDKDGTEYPTCALDLTPTYAVVSSCISFYVPCIVMIGIYCR